MKSRHRKVATRPHAPAHGRQAAGEERHVESCFPIGFPPTCRSASSPRNLRFPAEEELAGKVTDGKEIQRQRVPE